MLQKPVNQQQPRKKNKKTQQQQKIVSNYSKLQLCVAARM